MEAATVTLKIYEGQNLVHSQSLADQLHIGRQDKGQPLPYGICRTAKGQKLIIARSTEVSISRNQMLLELMDETRVRISNLSSNVPFHLANGQVCEPGDKHVEFTLPIELTMGTKILRIVPKSDSVFRPQDIRTLAQPTLPPGQARSAQPLADLIAEEEQLSAEALTKWLLDTMAVFQRGIGEKDYLQHATEALTEMIGLDSAAALLWDGLQWSTAATAGQLERQRSTTLLNRMLEARRSVRHDPDDESISSLDRVHSVAAAPILDPDGDIVGALYGQRQLQPGRPQVEISELEAMIVELIATGVANGIARLEQEQVAVQARVQFEQFFTPKLARELEENPQLLQGRKEEVTVLFCDIRGFSRITHDLGPEQTVAWLNDVLDTLSDCVVEYDGVLVDYVGDELMAMWGAPDPIDDHADKACQAAREMISRLHDVDEKWKDKISSTTEVSIGINTGGAHVGNIGSRRKFKYGPLGSTVNLGSRVQGATKKIRCDVILTKETLDRLQHAKGIRRLCQVEVVNIPDPVELYEMAVNPPDEWLEMAVNYETALTRFEQRDFTSAVELLGKYPGDGPSLVLLSRVIHAMNSGADACHPVWRLSSK